MRGRAIPSSEAAVHLERAKRAKEKEEEQQQRKRESGNEEILHAPAGTHDAPQTRVLGCSKNRPAPLANVCIDRYIYISSHTYIPNRINKSFSLVVLDSVGMPVRLFSGKSFGEVSKREVIINRPFLHTLPDIFCNRLYLHILWRL